MTLQSGNHLKNCSPVLSSVGPYAGTSLINESKALVLSCCEFLPCLRSTSTLTDKVRAKLVDASDSQQPHGRLDLVSQDYHQNRVSFV